MFRVLIHHLQRNVLWHVAASLWCIRDTLLELIHHLQQNVLDMLLRYSLTYSRHGAGAAISPGCSSCHVYSTRISAKKYRSLLQNIGLFCRALLQKNPICLIHRQDVLADILVMYTWHEEHHGSLLQKSSTKQAYILQRYSCWYSGDIFVTWRTSCGDVATRHVSILQQNVSWHVADTRCCIRDMFAGTDTSPTPECVVTCCWHSCWYSNVYVLSLPPYYHTLLPHPIVAPYIPCNGAAMIISLTPYYHTLYPHPIPHPIVTPYIPCNGAAMTIIIHFSTGSMSAGLESSLTIAHLRFWETNNICVVIGVRACVGKSVCACVGESVRACGRECVCASVRLDYSLTMTRIRYWKRITFFFLWQVCVRAWECVCVGMSHPVVAPHCTQYWRGSSAHE